MVLLNRIKHLDILSEVNNCEMRFFFCKVSESPEGTKAKLIV